MFSETQLVQRVSLFGGNVRYILIYFLKVFFIVGLVVMVPREVWLKDVKANALIILEDKILKSYNTNTLNFKGRKFIKLSSNSYFFFHRVKFLERDTMEFISPILYEVNNTGESPKALMFGDKGIWNSNILSFYTPHHYSPIAKKFTIKKTDLILNSQYKFDHPLKLRINYLSTGLTHFKTYIPYKDILQIMSLLNTFNLSSINLTFMIIWDIFIFILLPLISFLFINHRNVVK